MVAPSRHWRTPKCHGDGAQKIGFRVTDEEREAIAGNAMGAG